MKPPKKYTKARRKSALALAPCSAMETFAPASNKTMVLCGAESGPYVETEVAQHFRDALTGGKKSWTGTMWASGWVLLDGRSYPSVFTGGPHTLHSTHPDEQVAKAGRRDVQRVRVTITPAGRRLSPNDGHQPRSPERTQSK